VTDDTPNSSTTSLKWDYLNRFVRHVISDLSSPQLPTLTQLSVAGYWMSHVNCNCCL
jgi:hypothetical protein